MIAPKLGVGVARLLWKGQWVDAITDEVSRETARFVEWSDGMGAKFRSSRRGKGLLVERVAEYEDGLGRRWRQLSFDRRGIGEHMIVKAYYADPQHVVIESKDKGLSMQVPASGPLVARMAGKPVQFFFADVVNGIVELGEISRSKETW